MQSLVNLFAIGGIAFSALGILLRLVDRRLRRNLADILLSVALFAIMWYVFIYLMILTGYITRIPNLYNKGIPLYYLVAPCAYFYTRLKLYPAERLPRHWYVHAIPFVLGLVDIMPYAWASYAEKQALMERLVADIRVGFEHEYGFIHQQWHYVAKLLLAFVYLMAQWRLLFMVDTGETEISSKLLFSMYLFAIIYSLFVAVQVSMVLNILFNQVQASYILKDAGQLVWVSGLYLLFSIWICVGPGIRRMK